MMSAHNCLKYKIELCQYVSMDLVAKLRIGNEQWCLITFTINRLYHNFLTSTVRSDHLKN
jgi:hypothetical protein